MIDVDNLNVKQLFICGVGRSGTSLVQSMLSAHPKIAFLPETGFLRRYARDGVLSKRYRSGGRDGVLQALRSDQRICRLEIDLEHVTNQSLNDSPEFSDIAWYKRVLYAYQTRHDATIVGDKDPRAVEMLPFLRREFPSAQFLHVIRDPRDVLVSKNNANWSASRHWLTHLMVGRTQFRIGVTAGRQLDGRYHELLYERLLASPEATLTEVAQWIGVTYDPSMLHFAKAARDLTSEDEMQWKKETLGPLLTNNVGKWRHSLTAFQVACCESLCQRTMHHAGYSLSENTSQLGMVRFALVRLTALAARAADPLFTRLLRR